MARVTFEEEAFAVARYMAGRGWDLRLTLGSLLMLWHESQALKKVTVKSHEIRIWCCLKEEEVTPFIEALMDCQVLRPAENGEIYVCGNADHIGNLQRLKEASRNGGKATKARWKKISENKKLTEGHVAMPQAKPDATLQFSTVQYSSVQHNTNKEFQSLVGFGNSEPKNPNLPVELKKAEEIWLDALKFHNANRAVLSEQEKQTLCRAIQGQGFDVVELALLGAKHEPASESYKPSRHLALSRVFNPEKLERFINLGAQAKEKLKVSEQTRAQVEATQQAFEKDPEEYRPPNPEMMAEIKRRFGGAA